MTLLDFPGHVSCTIFTGGCNMRCPFCHNAALVLPEQLADEPDREEEVLALLKKRRGILEGVVVSGGEPLLQADVRSFIEYVKDLGYLVKLDTNGTFPKKLKELVGAGLVDYVAMDIKNAPALYRMMVDSIGENPERAAQIQHFLTLFSEIERQYYPVNAKFHLKEIEGIFSSDYARVIPAEGLTETFKTEVRHMDQAVRYLMDRI